MATYVNLTVPIEDIIGADYDPKRTAVYLETNTPNSLIVVDGVTLRAGGRREKVTDGVVTFANLVATNSASNPTSFAYRVQIVYSPVGSGHRDTWTSSDFPLTTSKNLAAIGEAFDGLAASPIWQSDFMDSAQALLDQQEAISGATTADALITVLDANAGSTFRVQQDARQLAAAKSVARTPFPAGLTGARFYDLSTGVYGARGYIPTAKKEIDRTRIAGNGLKRIACVGHSIVAGAGPVIPGSTAWPDRLRAILNQHGTIKAGTGVVIAQNGTTGRDSRYTFSAGWAVYAVNSPALVATSVGQTVTFASGYAGTQIDVYTYDSTGNMTVTIDGVAKTSIVGAFSGTVRKFSFTGLANTAHTVVLTTTTANQSFIVGMECHSGDGLSVSNLGIAGASIDQWAASTYYLHSGILRLIDPVLTFLECQVNDAKTGRTAADWKTYAAVVVDYAKESGECVIVIDPTPNPTAVGPYPAISSATWLSYRQAALDLGDEKGCPVIDMSEIYGSYALGAAAGWMFDSVHPTEIGSEVIARAAADLLL